MGLQARRESWFEHVRRAQREGRSVAAYARSIEVAPRVLYYWCGVLRREGAAAAEQRAGQALSSFTAVRVVEGGGTSAPRSESALRLLLPDGVQLQWSGLPNPQWLAAFTRELAQR
jgi:transposase-like protein